MPETTKIATKYTFTTEETLSETEWLKRRQHCQDNYQLLSLAMHPEFMFDTSHETAEQTTEFLLRPHRIKTITTVPYPNTGLGDPAALLKDLEQKLNSPDALQAALRAPLICPFPIKSESGIAHEFNDGVTTGTKQDILETFEVRPLIEALLYYFPDSYLLLLESTKEPWAKKILMDFSNLELCGVDLTGIDLTEVNVAGADLNGARLTQQQRKFIKPVLANTKIEDGCVVSWLKSNRAGSGSFRFFPANKVDRMLTELKSGTVKLNESGAVLATTKAFRVKFIFTTRETLSSASFDKNLLRILKKHLNSRDGLSRVQIQARMVEHENDPLMDEFSFMTPLTASEEKVASNYKDLEQQTVRQEEFDAILQRIFETDDININALFKLIKESANSVTLQAPALNHQQEIALFPQQNYIRTEYTFPCIATQKVPANVRRDVQNGQPTDLEQLIQNITLCLANQDSNGLQSLLKGEFIHSTVIHNYNLEPYESTLKFKSGHKQGKRQDIIEVYEVRPVLAALLVTHRDQYLKLLALSQNEACLRMLLDFSHLELSGADFTGIPLQLATFTGADFSGAVFTDEQRKYLKTILAEHQPKIPLLSWIKQKSSGQCLALQFSEEEHFAQPSVLAKLT